VLCCCAVQCSLPLRPLHPPSTAATAVTPPILDPIPNDERRDVMTARFTDAFRIWSLDDLVGRGFREAGGVQRIAWMSCTDARTYIRKSTARLGEAAREI
jgi:hypothetical protein